MLVIHEIRKQGFSWKTLITQHLSTKNEPVEVAQPTPDKDKEPKERKGKKDKSSPSSSIVVKNKSSKQVRPSSLDNKTLKSQESKGKSELVEEISTVALEEKGHTSKSLRKEKSRDEQFIEQSPITIP